MTYSLTPRFVSATLVVFAVSLLLVTPALAKSDNWGTRSGALRDAGDVLQIAIPLTGGLMTLIKDDREGRAQLAKATLFTLAVGQGLKYSYGKLRPNRGARTSFPSGHTWGAFYGAEFIRNRYGNWAGLPAYAGAVVTGYSRWWADAHFADDVIAGATMGVLTSMYFTSPYAAEVAVTPMAIEDGFGVNVAMQIGDDGRKTKPDRWQKPDFKPRYSLAIGFSPAYLSHNRIRANGSTGTTFDLDSFDKLDDPTTSGAANFEFYWGDRHTLGLSVTPFESRDRGTFQTPVTFRDIVFPAGVVVDSSYQLYTFSIDYKNKIIDTGVWSLAVGGALTMQHTDFELFYRNADGDDLKSSAQSNVVLPLLSAEAEYHINDRWGLLGTIDGFALDKDSTLDIVAAVKYRFNPQWDFSTGYWYFNRNSETSDLHNDARYDGIYLSVRHSF